ncbi:MAG: hypothetical protein ABR512_12130 [Desulfopila sp.]
MANETQLEALKGKESAVLFSRVPQPGRLQLISRDGFMASHANNTTDSRAEQLRFVDNQEGEWILPNQKTGL